MGPTEDSARGKTWPGPLELDATHHLLGNWKSLASSLQEEEETSHLAQEQKCLPSKLGRVLKQQAHSSEIQQGIAARHHGGQ